MSEREDGFYWARFGNSWDVVEYSTAAGRPGFWRTGVKFRYFEEDFSEIGPRVQRDSDLVKQRDELLAALKEAVKRNTHWAAIAGNFAKGHKTERDWGDMGMLMGALIAEGDPHADLIARIEAEKSGVKP